MSKAEDSLMESSAELRKQLCEAEHMLCDWYSTMWQRPNGWMIVWNWR